MPVVVLNEGAPGAKVFEPGGAVNALQLSSCMPLRPEPLILPGGVISVAAASSNSKLLGSTNAKSTLYAPTPGALSPGTESV